MKYLVKRYLTAITLSGDKDYKAGRICGVCLAANDRGYGSDATILKTRLLLLGNALATK